MNHIKHPAKYIVGVIIALTCFMFFSIIPSTSIARYEQAEEQISQENVIQQIESTPFVEYNHAYFEKSAPSWVIATYLHYLDLNSKGGVSSFVSNYQDFETSEKQQILTLLTSSLMAPGADQGNNQMEQLKYCAIGTGDNKGSVSNNNSCSMYLNDPDHIQDDDNTWYMVVEFDDEGEANIIKSSGSVTASTLTFNIKDQLDNLSVDGYYKNDTFFETRLTFETVKKIKMAFIVDSTSSLNQQTIDKESYSIFDNQPYSNVLNDEQSKYFTLACLAALLLAFILPWKKIKHIPLVNYLMSIPLELSLILLPTMYFPYIFNVSIKFAAYTSLSNFCVNIILFITTFTLIFYWVFFLKECFEIGLRKTFQNRSICRKNLESFKQLCRDGYSYLMKDDFTKAKPIRIFFIILCNVIFLSFLSALGEAGIILIPVYAIFVYYFMNKKQKLKNKEFVKVEQVINNISCGKYEENIIEDLGAYEPMKEDLLHIQQGIEDSINNAMISQRMKTELITNVSHDLKTPLTSIISYIELLKDPEIKEEDRKKYLDILSKSSDRLKRLIEDLFEMSKANSGNVSMEYMDVDLVSLMKQVELECKKAFEEKHLTIKYQLTDDKIVMQLDPQKAYRIFVNLMSNVGKYAMPHTRVFVSIQNYDTRVDVEIKNISKEELNFTPEEIVERFTRGDTSRNTEGSGLGLAIAKSFTELLQGTMRIDLDGDVFKVLISFYPEIK